MYITIYLIGYILCFLILLKIRNVREQNTIKDNIITLLLSLTSWVGVIIYGIIYLRFMKILLLLLSLNCFSMVVITKDNKELNINVEYKILKGKPDSIKYIVNKSIENDVNKLLLLNVQDKKNNIEQTINKKLTSQGYIVNNLNITFSRNIEDYILAFIISLFGVSLIYLIGKSFFTKLDSIANSYTLNI